MTLPSFKINWPKSLPQRILIVSFLAIIIFNVIVFIPEVNRIKTFKKYLKHQVIGGKFLGLENITKKINLLGYYSDTNDDESNKLFSQAQFILAPTVLDYNNTNHEFILLVCKNDLQALEKIKELNAEPLFVNKFGMILIRRKP